MRKSNRMKFINQPILKYLIIPLILFGVWVFASLLFNSYESFTSITYPNIKLQNSSVRLLVKHVVVTGTFIAMENNLGTILLKFPYVPSSGYTHQDNLIFRIKEQGKREWYSQNHYRSGMLSDIQTFPFGFPSIDNSIGKRYVFELESLNANSENAVRVGNTFNIRYILDKRELLHNPWVFISFIIKKLDISFFDLDFILSSFIYLVPLLIYVLSLLVRSENSIKLSDSMFKNISKNKCGRNILNTFIDKGRWIFLIILCIVFFYSSLTTKANIGVSVLIIGFWVVMIVIGIVNSRISFIFFIILLGLGLLGIVFTQVNFSTRISSWAYMFFLIGAIQAVFEEKSTK